MVNISTSITFLGETSQRLEGILADIYNALAVAGSGAERNVMSLQYAITKNLKINSGPETATGFNLQMKALTRQ